MAKKIPISEIKKNRAKWIEALLSGKFTQGQSTLKRLYYDGKYRHCCLGVACETLGLRFKKLECSDKLYIKGGLSSFLPRSARDKLGMTGKQQLALATHNDDNGYSFKKIASIIKRMKIHTDGI